MRTRGITFCSWLLKSLLSTLVIALGLGMLLRPNQTQQLDLAQPSPLESLFGYGEDPWGVSSKGQRLNLTLKQAKADLLKGDRRWVCRHQGEKNLWCTHPDGRSIFFREQTPGSLLCFEGLQNERDEAATWPDWLPRPEDCRVQHASVMGGRCIILAQTRGAIASVRSSYAAQLQAAGWEHQDLGDSGLMVYKRASLRCLLHWGTGPRDAALALVVDRLEV